MLFTFVGGRGHFEPLTPIVRAAVAAGHTVALGCAPAMRRMVRAEGFETLAVGSAAGRPRRRLPLLAPDRAREERDLRERFVNRTARARVPLVAALCKEWRPDLVVCDETDFGTLVAAEQLGLPFASVVVIGAGTFLRAEVIGEALGALRSEYRLPRDPTLATPSRHRVLSPFPPSYRHPAHRLPASAHYFRGSRPAPATGRPEWASALDGAPNVYFTLGTIFNTESGDLLARVVEGLRELPMNLLVTVGDEVDPAELGPQPANVHVERFVPQAAVLPHCDLVVSHGGSGNMLGALTHGLPAVLAPIGADQPLNAERCVELGVAVVLDPVTVSAADIGRATATVLEDPAYRRNAQQLRDEIAALPAASHAVAQLERLAAEHPGPHP